MEKLVWGLAIVLALGGLGLGLKAAYAEGDGCKTYVSGTFLENPHYFCRPPECNNPPEVCELVTIPYPECACDGSYQYPFCLIDWYWDPELPGYNISCTPLLCPSPGAHCEVKWYGLSAYCQCVPNP